MNKYTPTQSRRSFIFTPGLKPEMFPKALKSGTDMVCIELEDGIAPKDKELARKLAMKIFDSKQENDGVERILRVNCNGFFKVFNRFIYLILFETNKSRIIICFKKIWFKSDSPFKVINSSIKLSCF